MSTGDLRQPPFQIGDRASQHGDARRQRIRQLTQSIALLRNPEQLREKLKSGLQPDGTVVWGFSEDAAKLVRERGFTSAPYLEDDLSPFKE